MKILVTGACGQVGSHVAELLLARGDTVLGIDNLETGRAEHLPAQKNLELVMGSIADTALVEEAIARFQPDTIVHTAASYKDPENYVGDAMSNVGGMANLVQSAKKHVVKRFIYFQTALCYGVKPLQQPITLDHPIFPANSSYAISKTAAEDYLSISGLDYVSFRLANVVGPRNTSGPLPIFFQRLSEGKKCFVTPARRDFVFVGDLAANVVKACDGTGNGAYHFSSGTDIAIKELYDAVVKAMALNEYPEPDMRELSPDDAPSILLDPSRTVADFGKIQFTPLEKTVAAAVAYYREFGVVGGYTHLKHDTKKAS
ncbi:MAG: NAD-dependent epimerase/dehydratase family protein [Rickettsiales bacterium]